MELQELLLSEDNKQDEIVGNFALLVDKCVQTIEMQEHNSLIYAQQALDNLYSVLSVSKDVTIQNSNFHFGCIVCLREVMSVALKRVRPPLFEELLYKKDYFEILHVLYQKGEVKLSTLKYGLDDQNIPPYLNKINALQESRLVVSHSLGKEIYYSLSLPGRMEMDRLVTQVKPLFHDEDGTIYLPSSSDDSNITTSYIDLLFRFHDTASNNIKLNNLPKHERDMIMSLEEAGYIVITGSKGVELSMAGIMLVNQLNHHSDLLNILVDNLNKSRIDRLVTEQSQSNETTPNLYDILTKDGGQNR